MITLEDLKKDFEKAKANAFQWEGVCNYLAQKITEQELKTKEEKKDA